MAQLKSTKISGSLTTSGNMSILGQLDATSIYGTMDGTAEKADLAATTPIATYYSNNGTIQSSFDKIDNRLNSCGELGGELVIEGVDSASITINARKHGNYILIFFKSVDTKPVSFKTICRTANCKIRFADDTYFAPKKSFTLCLPSVDTSFQHFYLEFTKNSRTITMTFPHELYQFYMPNITVCIDSTESAASGIKFTATKTEGKTKSSDDTVFTLYTSETASTIAGSITLGEAGSFIDWPAGVTKDTGYYTCVSSGYSYRKPLSELNVGSKLVWSNDRRAGSEYFNYSIEITNIS